MSIDLDALDRALGREPVLGTTEISPNTGIALTEKELDQLQSRMKHGNPIDVYPGAVSNSTLRILGDHGYYPQQSDVYQRQQLARSQSSFGQFVNALNQAVVGEIVGGTLEGAGYLLDARMYADLILGKEQEFGNALSDIGRSLRTWSQEVSPIHVSPNSPKFDPGNWTWWMSHAPSVVSTLSLMIPSGLAVKGLGALAKVAGGERLLQGMAKLAGVTAKDMSWVTKGVSQAVISRHMENLMESSGVYEEIYNESKELGMSEEEAKRRAAFGASNTYKKQWAMLIQDVPQYLLLNRLGGAGSKETSLKVAKAMGIAPGKAIGAKAGAILKDMVSEGGEEAYQFLINEQSKALAQHQLDPTVRTSFSDILSDNINNGEMWSAALFGALGAGVMQAGFAGLNAKAIGRSNEERIKELQGRGVTFKAAYQMYQEALNSGDPVRQGQARDLLITTLAVNARNAGNTKNAIDMMEQLTKDPSDELLERHGIDREHAGALAKDPSIVEDLKRAIKRAAELESKFEAEVNNNKDIPKSKRAAIISNMVHNQLLYESTMKEKGKSDERLEGLKGTLEQFQKLSPTKQSILGLQGRIRAIKNPDAMPGSTDERTKPGVLDVLERKKKEQWDKLSKEEQALLDSDIAKQRLGLSRLEQELKEAQKNYGKEEQDADEGIEVTFEEMIPVYEEQRRSGWINASAEQLKQRMKRLRKGKIDEGNENPEDNEPDGAEVGDTVLYQEPDGTTRAGRVTKVENPDKDGKENADAVYGIQPLGDNGVETNEPPIVKSGLDVTLAGKEGESKEGRDDGSDTMDSLSDDEQVSAGLMEPTHRNLDQGTPTPFDNVAWYTLKDGNVVAFNKELQAVLNDPNTSYKNSEVEYYINSKNPYWGSLLKTADAKTRRYLQKIMAGKSLSGDEANNLLSQVKGTGYGDTVIDKMPIEVKLLIDGHEYTGGMYLHAADFNYIKVPMVVRFKEKLGSKNAVKNYIDQQKFAARNKRVEMLQTLLTGGALKSSGIEIGRGNINTISKSLPQEKRRRNLAQVLGIKADDITLGITRAGVASEISPLYVKENKTYDDRMRLTGVGNVYAVIKGETLNGEDYVARLNNTKISREHAAIILEAFKTIALAQRGKKYKRNRYLKINWRKGYDMVKNIKPGELIDLLVVHGDLTNPNGYVFKKRTRSQQHTDILKYKALFLTENSTILNYGFNPETGKPFQLNLEELYDAKSYDELAIPFLDWMQEHKNYAVHLSRYNDPSGRMANGIQLNGQLYGDRAIRIGRKHVIEKKLGEGYNAFLINNNLVTADFERDANDRLFKDPIVNLNTTRKGQVKVVKPGKAPFVPTSTKMGQERGTVKPKPQQPSKPQQPATKKPEPQWVEKPKMRRVISDKGKRFTAMVIPIKTPLSGEYATQYLHQREDGTWSVHNKYGTRMTQFGAISKEEVIKKLQAMAAGAPNEDAVRLAKQEREARRAKQAKQEEPEASTPKPSESSVEGVTETNPFGNKNEGKRGYQQIEISHLGSRLTVWGRSIASSKQDFGVSLFLVQYGNGLWGIYDETGRTILEHKHDRQMKAQAALLTWIKELGGKDKFKALIDQANKADKAIQKESTKPTEQKTKEPEPKTQEKKEEPKESKEPTQNQKNANDLGFIFGDETLTAEEEANLKQELDGLKDKDGKPAKPKDSTKIDPFADIDGADYFAMSASDVTDKQIDIEKELAWLEEKLGIADEVSVTDRIIKLAANGREDFAAYTHHAILLYEGAVEGTLYHEAFHRVSLGYFTKEERERIYRVARQYYNMPNASNVEIEEHLAERFREFVLLHEKEEAPKQHSTIRKFFRRLYEWIKSVFAGPNRLREHEIQRLFKSIQAGKYKGHKILAENEGKVSPGDYAMAASRREFKTITSTKHRRDIVKMLTAQFLKLNQVEDLETITVSNPEESQLLLFEWIDRQVKALNELRISGETEAIRQRAATLHATFNEINQRDNKSIFWDMIVDELGAMGIKGVGIEHLTRIGDPEYEDNQDEVGRIDVDKRSSWEVSVKDNAMGHIKFLINGLHATNKPDPITGIVPYVDSGMVWSRLLYHMNSMDTAEDMIEELRVLANDFPEDPWYNELADKLERGSENLRAQFATTFRVWKHEFVTFSFRNTRDGAMFTFRDNTESQLANGTALKWNERFSLSDRLVITGPNERGTIVKDAVIAANKDYERLALALDAVTLDKATDEELYYKYSNDFISLLGKLNILIDQATVNVLANDLFEAESPIAGLNNFVNTQLKFLIGSESKLVKEATMSSEELAGIPEERRLNVANALISNGVVYNRRGDSIAHAYAKAHPELQESIVIGAEGHKYFTYAANNMATDKVRKLKRDLNYIRDQRGLIYNKHSRILRLLEENPEVRKNFYLKTFSALRRDAKGDKGRDFTHITNLEEYVARFNAVSEGYLPLPIMADRKQFYLMSGIDTLKNVVQSIDYSGGQISLKFSEETLNLFYGYFLDERERVLAARALKAKYEAADTTEEERVALRKQMIKNYHYSGNFNLDGGNAYNFIHFKEFNRYKDAGLKKVTEDKVKETITKALNKQFVKEYEYAAKIGAISREGNILVHTAVLSSQRFLDLTGSITTDTNESDALVYVLGEFMINNMMGAIESDKVIFADPAFFKRNKKSKYDVSEDLFKRWFGVGSTGGKPAETMDTEWDNSYNVSILNTQHIMSKSYYVLHKRYTEIYKKLHKDWTDEQIKERVDFVLSAYQNVDPSDGQMIISPELYRSISKRLGMWPKEKDDAYQQLMSGKDLSDEKVLEYTLILQPLKTVYVGTSAENGLNVPVYDKMSMATIFRKQVKGTPLEDVLDRMELKGRYERPETPLKPIHAFKYDTAVKVGGHMGIDLFEDANVRTKVNNLSKAPVYEQYFENLKHQVVTDPHESLVQKVGSQAYKVITSNIVKDGVAYGDFKNGEDLLNALTRSRVAVSRAGREYVKAKFGIDHMGRINNKKFIKMLYGAAKSANRAWDFTQALRTEEDGSMYLELDAFTDRGWVYSRLMSIINENTVDLNLPGTQLIQVSGFGHAVKDKELEFSIDEEGNLQELEVRVSEGLFRHIIPDYANKSHKDRKEAVENVFRMIGYRVPVQGQNSTVRLKVKEVLPENVGDVIHLPLEFTALTGSDFDIDKLYVIMPHYMNGKEIEFSDSMHPSAVDNRYKQKAFELFNLYRGNKEILGEELLNKIQSTKIAKQPLGNHKSELVLKLKSLRNQANVQQRKLNETNDPTILDLWLETNEAISDLEAQLGVTSAMLDQLDDVRVQSIIDALVKAKVLPTRKAFEKLSIEEQNTKKANENRIIQMFHTVLGNDAHFLSVTSPLGVLTKTLQDKAERISDAELEGKELDSLEMSTPRFQSDMRNTFIGANKGIGAFALANAHHGLTQQADTALRTHLDLGLGAFDDRMWFNKIRGKDDVVILDWLSALIDSHVDAAKDPYIIKLNVNEATYNMVSLLLRTGLGETTFDFISQPILREYAQAYFDAIGQIVSQNAELAGATSPHKYAMNLVMERWEKLSGVNEEDVVVTNKLYERLDPEVLQKDTVSASWLKKAKPEARQEYYSRQIAILKVFDKLLVEANSLNQLVMASRIDTKKFGSTPIELNHFLNQIRAVEDSRNWVNLEKLLTSDGHMVEGATMLPELLKNSLLFALDIMADKSLYGTTGFNALYNHLLGYTQRGRYATKSDIANLTEELYTYLASKFFTDKENGLGVTRNTINAIFGATSKVSIFRQLDEIRKGTFEDYEDIKNNKFIQMLTIDHNETLPVHNHIRLPFHTLSEVGETDDYIDDFYELYNHTNPKIRNLAKVLYVYSFYTTGWRRRRHSFHSYIPTAMQKAIERKDGAIASFNEHIKRTLRLLENEEATAAMMTEARREIFQNNWFVDNMVPVLTKEDKGGIEKDGEDIGQILKIKPGIKTRLYLGTTANKHLLYSPYVLNPLEDGSELLEYVGYNSKNKTPVYRNVPKKGFLEHGLSFREYGISDEESILPANNNLAHVSEEEFLKIMTEDPDFVHVPFEEQVLADNNKFDSSMYFDARGGERNVEPVTPVEKIPTVKVVSSMQTGIGQTALNLATQAGMETGGVASLKYITERGSDPATGLKYGVREITEEEQQKYGTDSFWSAATQVNVFESDATLYISPAPVKGEFQDSGNYFTHKNYAENAGKPFLSVSENANPHAVRNWLVEHDINTLNIAGPRSGKLTTTQLVKIQRLLATILTGKNYDIQSSKSLSSYNNPIKIFTDGSYTPQTKKMGYGAFFKWGGKEYKLSGTNTDVARVLKEFDKIKPGSPTMELVAILETLTKFRNTSEHLYIHTDQENNINYEGLWERAFRNRWSSEVVKGESGKRTKATKPNATGTSPWLTYLIDQIVDNIEAIEENGGSVRFQWIPGHINADKADANIHAFLDENGVKSEDIINEFKYGNDVADALASSPTRQQTFLQLGAPTRESVDKLIEVSDANISNRTEDNLLICEA